MNYICAFNSSLKLQRFTHLSHVNLPFPCSNPGSQWVNIIRYSLNSPIHSCITKLYEYNLIITLSSAIWLLKTIFVFWSKGISKFLCFKFNWNSPWFVAYHQLDKWLCSLLKLLSIFRNWNSCSFFYL